MSLLVTLIDNNKSFDYVLPKKVAGKYIINTKDDEEKLKPLIIVEEEEGKWVLKSNKNAFLKDNQDNLLVKIKLQPSNIYKIFKKDSTFASLIALDECDETHRFKSYKVNTDIIKIGTSKESNILFRSKLVSENHCYIKYSKNYSEAVIIDNSSDNGIYVNGEKVTEKRLLIGDVVYIMGLKIIYNVNILSINNPNNSVTIDEIDFTLIKRPVTKNMAEDILDEIEEEVIEEDIFFRSPRFKNDIKKREFKIDSPPPSEKVEDVPVMYMLGPAITMGMASLITSIVSVQNVISNDGDIKEALPMILMSFSMIIGTVLWPVLTKRHEKKKNLSKEKIREEKYKKYIEKIRNDIQEEAEKQRRILYANNISIYECIEMISNRDINIWERIIEHNDFAKVRLGVGNIPLEADFKYQEKKFSLQDDKLQDELYRLIDEPKILQSVPITISLLEEKASGIIGDRESAKFFIKSLIFQLATLQGYDQLKFIFLYDEEEETDWAFARWLPHSWNEDKSIRFICTNIKDVKEISLSIEKLIIQRKTSNSHGKEKIIPHYIIFSMSKGLEIRAEFIKSILEENENLGFSIVSLYDEIRSLPKECSTVIEVTDTVAQIYDKDDITGKYIEFNMEIDRDSDYEKLAKELSNINLNEEKNKNTLPEMITFLEMFKVGKIEHLNILERWQENDPTKTIETEVGVDTMGEVFKLDLHEKFHGPHGLIAGMTGSGKSEFIMTFILSLAINYHPDEVAFILIDYKGGGMANAFTNLPHISGTITNLDGAAVKRSLISIESELKRRQSIFYKASKQTQISNIDIYKYQKLYREGKVNEPLSHLFIISDEFAELKVQQPEFMEQLISAARIGRSLGVHLILATQKPAGVVDDQIWSNSRFRVCLKVQEKADSMDVIKRPDAAEIAETGRFYLQVGFNELFEMGQSAWSGAPYYPTNKFEADKNENITVIDNIGRVLRSTKIDKKAKSIKNPPKQIDEIVKYIIKIADEENIKARPIWLEPIKSVIYLDDIKNKYNIKDIKYKFNPVVGEYDDPVTQSQYAMTIPICKDGNVIIYGASGSGKTTFITTIIYSLLEGHSPEEINIYILDFGSEILRVFEKAPHVGEVLLSYENEKINNLFKILYSEIEKRKKLFVEFGGDYNSYIKNSGSTIEALLIIINNITAFTEAYEELSDKLAYLIRECTKYGIYFVTTVPNINGIRYKLAENFKYVYSLQLNDNSEYVSILGQTDGVIPAKYKGRGIFKVDNVYEFQIALPFKDLDNTFELIRRYCNKYSKEWNGKVAKKIPVLPKKVDLIFFKDEIARNQVNQVNEVNQFNKVPIGIEKSTLKTLYYDFDKEFITVVLSQDQSKNSFGQGLAEVMSNCIDCRYKEGEEAINEIMPSNSNVIIANSNDKVTLEINGVEINDADDSIKIGYKPIEKDSIIVNETKEIIKKQYESIEKDEVIVIDAINSFIDDDNKKYRYINDSSQFEDIAVELFNTLVERHKAIKNSKECRNNKLKEDVSNKIKENVSNRIKEDESNKVKRDSLKNQNEVSIKALNYKNIKCIINSFSEFYKYLSADGKDKVNVFMLNGKVEYNINFIIIEDINNLNSFVYEEWFSKHVSLNNGIWIGNGISEQYHLKLNKISKEMYSDIGDDFGYVINDSKAKLTKLLTSINNIQGE